MVDGRVEGFSSREGSRRSRGEEGSEKRDFFFPLLRSETDRITHLFDLFLESSLFFSTVSARIQENPTMALSRYDPFMGSALYDPFSLFLGTPLGGGGQVSSSRGGLEQRLRPIHLDVKGCPFLFFRFLHFPLFRSFPSCRRRVFIEGGKSWRESEGGWRRVSRKGTGGRNKEATTKVAFCRRRVASARRRRRQCMQANSPPLLPTTFLTLSSTHTHSIHQKSAETDKAFEILADVPGVKDSRVNLSVDGDLVTIEVSEEHEKKEEDPQARYYRSERSASFQSRSVRLPPSAKMDELKADVEHGVLHVRVPKEKKEEKGGKGPRRIKIGGGGGGGGGVISAEEVKGS